jgi:hypothetical protein
VSQFNIQVVCFDIGHFRTPITSPTNSRLKITDIEDYGPMMMAWASLVAAMDGNQPGDPKLNVKVMVNVIKREGKPKGRSIPCKMPIGYDVVQVVKSRCDEILKVIDEWDDLGTSTDFPEPRRGFGVEQDELAANNSTYQYLSLLKVIYC